LNVGNQIVNNNIDFHCIFLLLKSMATVNCLFTSILKKTKQYFKVHAGKLIYIKMQTYFTGLGMIEVERV